MSGHPILTGLSRYRGILGLGIGLMLGSTLAAIATSLPAVATTGPPDSLRVVAPAPEAPTLPAPTQVPIPFGEGETLRVGVKPIIPFIFVEDSPIPYGY
jgi:hypothetical protein